MDGRFVVRCGMRVERVGRDAVIDRAEKGDLRSEEGECEKGLKVEVVAVVAVERLRWGEEGRSWRESKASLWSDRPD